MSNTPRIARIVLAQADTVAPQGITLHDAVADIDCAVAIPAPPSSPTKLLASYLAGECFRPLSTRRAVEELSAAGASESSLTIID
jgi:hypothetical protein